MAKGKYQEWLTEEGLSLKKIAGELDHGMDITIFAGDMQLYCEN